jgi:hypothetical protein
VKEFLFAALHIAFVTAFMVGWVKAVTNNGRK